MALRPSFPPRSHDADQAGAEPQYAIAGALAIPFWREPIPSFDLDVRVFHPESTSPIVSLDPIYRWPAAQGFPVHAEHPLHADGHRRHDARPRPLLRAVEFRTGDAVASDDRRAFASLAGTSE